MPWLRLLAGLVAIGLASHLAISLWHGEIAFGTGGGVHRPSTRWVHLRDPIALALGAIFLLHVVAIFAGVALKPAMMLRLRVILPLVISCVLFRLVIFVFYG